MVDIIIILVFLLFVLWGFKKGLVMALFGLVSFVLSIFLAGTLYPYAATALRSSKAFVGFIENSVTQGFFERVQKTFAVSNPLATADEFIRSLSLPGFITNAMIENDTPEIRDLLNVSSVNEYAYSYITNAVINVFALILTFVLVYVLLRVIGVALKIASRLPVINTFNKIGGLIAGAFVGGFVVWLLLSAAVLFVAGSNETLYAALNSSVILRLLQDSNLFFITVRNVKGS